MKYEGPRPKVCRVRRKGKNNFRRTDTSMKKKNNFRIQEGSGFVLGGGKKYKIRSSNELEEQLLRFCHC